MADIFTKKKRSQIMTNVHSSETKPEIIVRKFIFSRGFRFRKNVKRLPGKPDIVLSKFKTAIFIHGCFWHGHKGCKYAKLPATRSDFWKTKIDGNIIRDKQQITALKKLGWKVIIVWQCQISSLAKLEHRLRKLVDQIEN
jgi:DNA mismatch endonuclease, patch repair protein